MKCDPEKRQRIFDRTSGKCHICHEALEFLSYGKDGGWEIEHSNPRARGGTDRLNNLYPAHAKCNRFKGARSTSFARKRFGKTRAPLSVTKRKQEKIKAGFLNGLGMAAITTALRVHPSTGLLMAAVTAAVSFLQDPDDY